MIETPPEILEGLMEMVKRHLPNPDIRALFTYKLAEYTLALKSNVRPQVIEQEGEWLVPTPAGQIMAISTHETNPEGVDYVSFRNYDGEELAVFALAEIQEDTEFVLGALFGAFIKGALDLRDLD